MQKKVAIFDIDGTIFRSSLFIKLIEDFIDLKIFPEKARKDYLSSYCAWLDRQGPYEDYLDKMIEIFNKYLKGVKRKDFQKVSQKIASTHKNRVYRFTRDLIKEFKKKGYYLLAISRSPKIILDYFCQEWEFDKVYGFIYEFDKNDKATGKALYQDLIMDKDKIVKRAVQKENLTLADSVGVGDSASDISFLKIVDYPICFNPNKELYKQAKKNGWKIVVERKDVIYEI